MNPPIHRSLLVAFFTLLTLTLHAFAWGDAFTYSTGNLGVVSGTKWFTLSGSSTISVDSTKSAQLTSSRNDSMVKLLLPRDGAGAVQHWSGTALYARFDLHVGNVPTTTEGEYFLCFSDTTGNRRARVFVQLISASNIALGTGFAVIHPSSSLTDPLALGSDHTVVVKLDPSNKHVTLWLDPVNEASASVVSTDTSSQINYDVAMLRQSNQYGGVGTLNIDNLIYSDTFPEVVGKVYDPTDSAIASTPATPNNASDNDGPGLRSALTAVKSGTVPSILLLPTGTYNVTEAGATFYSDINYTIACRYSGINTMVFDGNGSTLMMSSTNRPAGFSPAYCAVGPLFFDSSSHLTFRNLTLDYERASFTSGTVGHVTIDTPTSPYTRQWTFPVAIEGAPLQDAGDGVWAVGGITDMDATTGLPLVNVSARDSTVAGKDFISWSLTSSNTYSVTVRTNLSNSGFNVDRLNHLDLTMAQLEGCKVVMHHPSGGSVNGIYGAPALGFYLSTDLHFKDVVINNSTGMGIKASQCTTLDFQRVSLTPNNGRILSTAKDGIFLTLCHGAITLDNCLLDRNGDDGLNVHATKFIRLTGTNTSLTWTGTAGDGTDPGPTPAVGDVYEFCNSDPHTPFYSTGTTVFTSTLTGGSKAGKVLTLAFSSVPSGTAGIHSGDFAIKKNGYPTLSVTNSTVTGGLARGVVLSLESGSIANCNFKNIAFNGVYFVADTVASGAQAPGSKNIFVVSSTFEGCGAAPIATYSPSGSNRQRSSNEGMFQTLRITNNTFISESAEGINAKRLARATTGGIGQDAYLGYMQSGIFFTAVSGSSLIQSNTFSGTSPNGGFFPALLISHVTGATVENNVAPGMSWFRCKLPLPTVHYDPVPSFGLTPTGTSNYLNALDEIYTDVSGNPITVDSSGTCYVRQLGDIQ